jgi:protein phosphatase methylesterase 1
MSQFQRAFARAKLSGLPLEPPMPEGTLLEQNEEENDPRTLPEPPPDDDSSSASSASSTGTIVPSPSKRRFARSSGFVNLIGVWFHLFEFHGFIRLSTYSI